VPRGHEVSGSVCGPVHGTPHLSLLDGDPVARDRDLEFCLGCGPLIGTERREDPAKEEVQERPEHSAALSQTRRSRRGSGAIVFLDPTGDRRLTRSFLCSLTAVAVLGDLGPTSAAGDSEDQLTW